MHICLSAPLGTPFKHKSTMIRFKKILARRYSFHDLHYFFPALLLIHQYNSILAPIKKLSGDLMKVTVFSI